MTPPAPMSDEELIESTTDFFVTESTLNPNASAGDIIRFARLSGLTATITFHVNQGGVGKIIALQKTALKKDQAVKARNAIGMRSV